MSSKAIKTFSIIEDKDGQKLVVPSLWISIKTLDLMWPPLIEPEKIKKLASTCAKPTEEWSKYKFSRFVKSKG